MTPSTAPLRRIGYVMDGRAAEDGGGVKLTRVLDPRTARLTDPFLLFDEFRSDDAADWIAGFPPHPHRGFETVTYMLAGRMRHGDNKGNTGDLGPGSLQWMTAARGIVHEEMPQQEDGLMWGYQLWVNLPASEKMAEPGYQDIAAERIPEVALQGGGRVRVLAGRFGETEGPVGARPTQPVYLDISLPPGEALRWTPPAGHTVLVHGVSGQFALGGEAQAMPARRLAVLTGEGDVLIRADAQAGARALVIAGRPLREPVAHYGPFVMNTDEELRQAVADYQAGLF
ncbi:MAG: pirin family protein [Xanthomonadales bacterium]|nr:pirin family protein [Xanthomonadales bacterium]